MSSLPGLTLEAYLAWFFDLVVEGQPEANVSLGLAEAVGIETRRTVLTPAEFGRLVLEWEGDRERIESWLAAYDEESQSWRDYASGGW